MIGIAGLSTCVNTFDSRIAKSEPFGKVIESLQRRDEITRGEREAAIEDSAKAVADKVFAYLRYFIPLTGADFIYAQADRLLPLVRRQIIDYIDSADK